LNAETTSRHTSPIPSMRYVLIAPQKPPFAARADYPL
jgi:hypothetical protein